ncbi:carbamoyltransferase HypF [Clostridium estertheticum]|uniref:carbamoyltransferase HypF n=1 Tax=Clostridium estertheticum TaxID=238834 RepID=UPI001C7DB574|nr:carbamoyltransferase HypF [Clostridium estertheticum]MBX4267757.1 carbamoyltransferase HypF [Clostridium estertheticum]WLC78002.1 carbamoyltransferase HypF [Clostridium estertheticum]
MDKKRSLIVIEGIVQGVGFRPFVYNLAETFGLKGWVNNNSEGVYIEVEGFEKDISKFMQALKNNPPPLSRIERITVKTSKVLNYSDFRIKRSEQSLNKITLISPDIATCSECEEDILNLYNRRTEYAFTNCTNCGPRFSIIKELPYDRDKTTMNDFKMCRQCNDEYLDPINRRFHAQPNACRVCGPELWIEDSKGIRLEIENPMNFAQNMIMEGKILAIKGLGGFHLACDGLNETSVSNLRERKKRPFKPLAVMMKNIETVKKYCRVNQSEEKVLTGIKKPIVILDQSESYDLSKTIAPNQKTIGVMLPYTPIHILLFSEKLKVLIMTSANVNGLPIEYKNSSARIGLAGIVDYFLMHNREIHVPVDDSVVKVINNKQTIIRRARGFVPEPFKWTSTRNILACGSNMKNTFCISKDGFLFLSQFNGDLENLETYEHYKENVEHFKNIFSFSPKFIAHDMHPGYMSTKYALEYDLPRIVVQHHHAHIVSNMFENNLKEKVIGVCFDGTGYGGDGKMWGGEFLVCDYSKFTRVAHLDYIKMPGGEKAIKEPFRMGVSYLYKALSINNNKKEVNDIIYDLYGSKGIRLINILDSNINCIETSSMGRLFDAMANIIGITDIVTYEGQASIELEAISEMDIEESYTYKIIKQGMYIIDPYEMIIEILKDKKKGLSAKIITSKFQNTVVNLTVSMCKFIRQDSNINDVVLSGGVFQNCFLLTKICRNLKKFDFKVYTHKDLPSNDGGISIGQVIIANAIIEKSSKKLIKMRI